MSHPYERMVGLLFLLFLLVVDGNEQLLAGVYAKLGVDVAHVVVERRRLGDTAKRRLIPAASAGLAPSGLFVFGGGVGQGGN